jgi:CRISPR-associated endonuclease/helicase Cas3
VQPTILCSTVDQVGSRLLFRGYGVSDSMKPIHAGLLGSDSLILLDEAHLSEPFRQTLQAVARSRLPSKRSGDEASRKNDEAPFAFVVLTATPKGMPKRPFGLGPDDYAHPILSARVTASKPAHLVEISGKQGVDTESRRVEVICSEVTSVLERIKSKIANPAIGVVVNRVSRARAIFEQLRSQFAPNELKLIIGPARAVDREQRAQELEPIRTGQGMARAAMAEPLVVVATQTIEAGVDIDFDGLVTEAAALDALRQRFGRLNRAGRHIEPEAVILVHKEDIGSKANDPVYGDRIAKTWAKLKELAPGHHDRVDFGIVPLRTQIPPETAAELAAPTLDAPILMPAYVDLWSQTLPIPNADPEVALFLHGPDRAPATVQIVWRADLDEQSDLRPAMEPGRALARLVDLFKLVPPRASEAIEVPLWAARTWLERSSGDASNFSDVVDRSPEAGSELGAGRRAFRWAGEDSEHTGVVRARELKNGDLIVVPAEYGGCDEWGWSPRSNRPVIDVADGAARPYRRRRFAVRVTPSLVLQEFANQAAEGRPSVADPLRVAHDLLRTLAEHREDRVSVLLEAVRGVDLPDQLRANLDALARRSVRRPARVFGCYRAEADESPGGVVFIALGGLEERNAEDEIVRDGTWSDGTLAAVPATESDDLGVAGKKQVSLAAHCREVAAWAEGFAKRAGLPSPHANDVTLAAFLHDPGKADPRFQAFLAGGDPYGKGIAEPIAKSGEERLPGGAWERAGLPDRWRHEALSVRLAAINPIFAEAKDRELVLWLIGTHHGFGRPMFSHLDPLDEKARHINLPTGLGSGVALAAGFGPQSLAFNFNGHDWAQIFELLKERYGVWELARLEAFVRLADHRASECGMPPEADASSRRVAA